MRLFTVAMGAGNDAMMAVWEGKVFGERFGFWESCSWAGSAGHGHGATPSVVLCQPASSQHPSPGPKKPPGRQAGGDRAHHGIPAGNLISSPFLGRCPLYQTCTLRPATCGHSHRRTDNSCLIFFFFAVNRPPKAPTLAHLPWPPPTLFLSGPWRAAWSQLLAALFAATLGIAKVSLGNLNLGGSTRTRLHREKCQVSTSCRRRSLRIPPTPPNPLPDISIAMFLPSAAKLLLSASVLLSSALAHNIQLPAHGRECFHESLHRDDKMTVTFQVGDREFGSAGNLDIDFWVWGLPFWCSSRFNKLGLTKNSSFPLFTDHKPCRSVRSQREIHLQRRLLLRGQTRRQVPLLLR